MNRWLLLILPLLLLFACASPAAAQAPDVTGVWTVNLKSPRGPFTIKATIKQEGEKLSGTATGPRGMRSEPIQGTIKGAEIKVTCNHREANSTLLITLTGEVAGDAIKGKADFGGVFESDWTAARLAKEVVAETDQQPAADAAARVPSSSLTRLSTNAPAMNRPMIARRAARLAG